jgi:hypothetical protein
MKDDVDFAQFMEVVALDLLGPPARKRGNKWFYGRNGSVTIDVEAGLWNDFENDLHGGTLAFIEHEKGCSRQGALQYLRDKGLLPPREAAAHSNIKDEAEATKAAYDPSADPCIGIKIKKTPRKPKFEIVKTWAYTDEEGDELFEVCRLEDGTIAEDGKRNKTYRQRHKTSDGYEYSVKGIRQVPYALPRLLKGIEQGVTIFIVEGEKCADAMISVGAVATTSPAAVRNFTMSLFHSSKARMSLLRAVSARCGCP